MKLVSMKFLNMEFIIEETEGKMMRLDVLLDLLIKFLHIKFLIKIIKMELSKFS